MLKNKRLPQFSSVSPFSIGSPSIMVPRSSKPPITPGGRHHRPTTTAYLPVLQSGQWRHHYITQIPPKVHN
ncbi:hypothetical protein Hanom_Chr03g00239471 [Helianthus anomalus]